MFHLRSQQNGTSAYVALPTQFNLDQSEGPPLNFEVLCEVASSPLSSPSSSLQIEWECYALKKYSSHHCWSQWAWLSSVSAWNVASLICAHACLNMLLLNIFKQEWSIGVITRERCGPGTLSSGHRGYYCVLYSRCECRPLLFWQHRLTWSPARQMDMYIKSFAVNKIEASH